MSDPASWLAIAMGGALGAVFRAAAYRFVDFRFRGDAGVAGTLALPSTVATLGVNVVGSLLLGVVVGTLAVASDGSASTHGFWATGVCGSLTTFSTFCADAVALASRRERIALCLYLLGNASLSLLAILAGLVLSN